MPEREFVRERLGVWDEGAGEDSALNVEAWARLFDGSSRALDPVSFALDVSPDGVASIASAGRRGDDLLHVEVVENRPGAGGNIATVCQIDEPVKPTTVLTPNFAAALAVSFISSAARFLTPSGSPSPQIRGDKIPLWRSSIG